MKTLNIAILLIMFLQLGCQSGTGSDQVVEDDKPEERKTIGSIEHLDPALQTLVAKNAMMEIMSEGYDWTEGPLWVEEHQMLLFSDIPPNTIFKWTEEEGATLFLKPSGFTGGTDREGEPGSNGLLLDPQGRLVLCQHGDRQMARYTGSLTNPQPVYASIVSTYDGKRFNSPNDGAYSPSGMLYFTDPPYGLEGNVNDPAKEIPFQGVYRVKENGEAELLIDSLSRPNGIAFSKDGRKLYVANSDPKHAVWIEYQLDEAGIPTDGRIFYDATSLVGQEKGLPDGLKVHSNGMILATGPGGVWIFSPSGQVLGKLKTGQATSNCALDDKEEHLYITADMFLVRLKLQN
ncbi:MAG: SMP-30/gluconolactonase/LRE family protein [Saprospiraceae bacterium]|nr:SMP-30/gluconolactonase/LRE family protein [Saprospiraceae bacterium]